MYTLSLQFAYNVALQCWLAYNGIFHFPSDVLRLRHSLSSSVLFNCFWHVALFQNTHKHVARLYIFLVFTSIFAICWFHNRFWHLAHFRNARRHVGRLYFSCFHERPQKSYQNKFQKCCPTKILKKSRKSFPISLDVKAK